MTYATASVDNTKTFQVWNDSLKKFVKPVSEGISRGAHKIAQASKIPLLTAVTTCTNILGSVEGFERVGQLFSYGLTAASSYGNVSRFAKTLITFGNAEQILGFANALESFQFVSAKLLNLPSDPTHPAESEKAKKELEAKGKLEKELKVSGEWAYNLAFLASSVGGVALTLNSWNLVQLGAVATPLLHAVGAATAIGFLFLGTSKVVELYYLPTKDVDSRKWVDTVATLARCVAEIAVRVLLVFGATVISPFVLISGISAKIVGLVPFGYNAYCDIYNKYNLQQSA